LFSRPRFFIAITAALFFTACALVIHAKSQGPNPQAKKSTSGRSSEGDGKKTFESVCASCHGLDGRGGERGPNIATRAEVQGLSDEDTLHTLEAGKPAAGMPAFASFGAPKLKAVLSYLRTLQGGGKALQLPGDPQKGQALFFGKAGCSNCHMVHGVGGFLGADLSSFGSRDSLEGIRNAITNPNEDLNPLAQAVVVTTRQGTQFTGLARNEDNFSLQLQTADGTFHLFQKSDLQNLERQPKSLMPSDYGTVLSSRELDDLVSYLADAARKTRESQPSRRHEDDE
jgi:cytochrome c oxidase cbb3-type subunit III